MKFMLQRKVEKILTKNNFKVFLTHCCFDIVAKRNLLLLIKVLLNIDSLSKTQALSIRNISHFLSAYPFVISYKTGRERLKDKIVYYRFGLPVTTPNLFRRIIEEDSITLTHISCLGSLEESQRCIVKFPLLYVSPTSTFTNSSIVVASSSHIAKFTLPSEGSTIEKTTV